MYENLHQKVDALVQASNSQSPAQSRSHQVQQTGRHSVGDRKPNLVHCPSASPSLPLPKSIPRAVSLVVCLHYLSTTGVYPRATQCHGGREHFVPKALHALVEAEINKRFGGIKQEYKALRHLPDEFTGHSLGNPIQALPIPLLKNHADDDSEQFSPGLIMQVNFEMTSSVVPAVGAAEMFNPAVVETKISPGLINQIDASLQSRSVIAAGATDPLVSRGKLSHVDSNQKRLTSTSQITWTSYSARIILHSLGSELPREEAKSTQIHRREGCVRSDPTKHDAIDMSACKSLSDCTHTQQFSVEEATRFVRGQTTRDNRPTKALDPVRRQQGLGGYPHLDVLMQIAEREVSAKWRDGLIARRPPPKNITIHVQNIYKRPLGVALEKGVDTAAEVRTKHDLSYPSFDSVNGAFVVDSAPVVPYEPVVKIAMRIEMLAGQGFERKIRLLKGDVKSSFAQSTNTC
ncbi:hypothetical protein ON010_g13905 [Phytophthora cinnamomi]|nr:hypothetical protein ON010_g13905 [Phytophthora cinnamomi]